MRSNGFRSRRLGPLVLCVVVLCSLAACGRREEPAQPAAEAEEPPPPEPASALGTATGSFKAADFVRDTDYYAYEKDRSEANWRKAQGRVDARFRSAIAKWKAGAHTLDIYLFPEALSAADADALRQSIVNDEGLLIRSRMAKAGDLVTVTLEFASGPPYDAAHLSEYIVAGRADNGRTESPTGGRDSASFIGSLPAKKASWAKPGRLLPEIQFKARGGKHWSGSSFGRGDWDIVVRVPVIYTTEY